MRLAKIIPGRGEYRRKHSHAVGDGKPGVNFGVIKDFNSFFNGTTEDSQRITTENFMNTCCKAIYSSFYINNYECKFRLTKSSRKRIQELVMSHNGWNDGTETVRQFR